MNIIKGIIIGVSNIIPGVSGGTMAMVLGIYEKLLNSINNLRTDFKASIKFLSQIVLGAVLGIIVFSKIMSYSLANYSVATNYLFVGLVIGSIDIIYNKIDAKKISLGKIISFGCGILSVMLISIIGKNMIDKPSQELVFNFSSIITLGLAGFVTAVTMLLPGVSGSLTLVMLGLYDTLVSAVASLNPLVLIPCAIGGLIGICFTSKFIIYLLEKYNDLMYCGIIGLVLASVFIIVFNNPVGNNVFSALIAVVIGCLTTKVIKIIN